MTTGADHATGAASRDSRARTTGIGSLPHHNADAALEFSFRMGIPFLPQIPIRNPWEFMIAQALEGLPGLQADSDGSVTLNTDIWLSRAARYSALLEQAFESDDVLESFEPTPSISSCWQPFVWELEERRVSLAKIQIAGPMTCQWAIKLKDSSGKPVTLGAFAERHPELSTQIFRTVLARALAMSKRLKRAGIQPLLFLDEPGLYSYQGTNARHVLAVQELKVLVQTLTKQGVQVGIHCCGNTDWGMLLSLPIQFLSLDTSLSLGSLLSRGDALKRFLKNGGRLSLGVIPTGRASVVHSIDVEALYQAMMGEFAAHLGGDASGASGASAPAGEKELMRKAISEAIYTPACGLALQSTAEAEAILESLTQFEARVRKRGTEGDLPHGSGSRA